MQKYCMAFLVMQILMEARVISLFMWKSFAEAMEEGGTAKCQDTNRCR